MRSSLRYFKLAFIVTTFGLLLGAVLGYLSTGTFTGMISTLVICSVLAVLEISLSFDNAIVNAKILKDMSPVWQHRFLTWGILIAVFGMRVLFPLVIVAIAAGLGPIAAVELAIAQPEEYARILTDAHVGIAGFGGTFLMMVGIEYFFDSEKEVHWIAMFERRLSRYGSIKGIQIMIVLFLIMLMSSRLPDDSAATFVAASIYGLLTFLAVDGLSAFLNATQEQTEIVHKAGVASFLYLQVLDASFSFDGVIAAFAISNILYIIAIGLGIGAMYVRSMTIMLVDRGTLQGYRYLEHGAFYAILALAAIMYLQTLVHIPEFFTALIGAVLIGVSLWASIAYKRREL